MIKTIPEKKKCKKAKWLYEKALQIAGKRREAKGKGEKERYTHLNAEFQRIARRDKKAFLSDQYKEIEENNRMGKTIEISSRKLKHQGNISCKDGNNEGQKWYGLNRSRKIKRSKEYTEELYKRDLHDPDNHDRVISHLETDILDCEVK